jgi:predicted RNA-binding protein with PIN domain
VPKGDPLLVDGMNVIGSRPDGWWRDRAGAMRALVESLDEYARATGESVTVVFDGKPIEMPGAHSVEVAFASGGRNAADREIVCRLEAADDRSALRVVTSDGALAQRAEELGAEVVPAGGFRRRLDR